MILSNIKNKSILTAIKHATQKCYGDLHYPVYIKLDRKLTGMTHGLYERKSVHDYERLPTGISPKDRKIIEGKYNGYFHYISLSVDALNGNTDSIDQESSYWEYKNIYTEEDINEHPSLCWLTTVLTHELQHAWQADDVHLGYRVKSNDMPLVEGMDKQWRRNLYEYDAEVGATKIRKFYITLMKENIEESDGR